MIYIFRKEIKKWHSVLWVVFISLALGGLSSVIFYRYKAPNEQPIAAVNGKMIPFKKFQFEVGKIQNYINMLRSDSRFQNIPIDLFLSIYGLNDPAARAMDIVIRERILDTLEEKMEIVPDAEQVRQALISSLPVYLFNQDGSLNLRAYRNYLSQMKVSVQDYEENKEVEVRREVVTDIMQHSYYMPNYRAQDLYIQENAAKKFGVAKVSIESFLKKIEKHGASAQELNAFYDAHKEDYRIPEKRKAQYFVINVAAYGESLVIDDSTIERYYERHKNVEFRIPPKVKVRRILIKEAMGKGATQVAEELRAQLLKDPTQFALCAQKNSQDTATSSKGGLVDFFEKGTYDPAFEREAFRLQTAGEISPVITTGQGCEIIQLVDRVPSEVKPLSSVRNEITKAIKSKRTDQELKRDILALIQKMKSDPQAFTNFAQNNKVKIAVTSWLSPDEAYGQTTEGKIAEKLFAAKKREGVFGHIQHDEDFIVYQMSDLQESILPSFNAIEKEVKSSYFKDKAHAEIKIEFQALKKDVFSKKTSLAEAAKARNFEFVQTEMLKRSAPTHAKLPTALVEHLFTLSSPEQIYEYKDEGHYYLGQLEQREQVNIPVDGLQEAHKKEEMRGKGVYLEAFIASLLRTAKIEKFENFSNVNNANVEWED